MQRLQFGWISHFLMQRLAEQRSDFTGRALRDPQKIDEFGYRIAFKAFSDIIGNGQGGRAKLLRISKITANTGIRDNGHKPHIQLLCELVHGQIFKSFVLHAGLPAPGYFSIE